MKKTLLIVTLVVLALGAFGVGAALAQDGQPPYGPGMMAGGGYGWMHEYVEQALAEKLGLTEEQVEEQLASGKTMYQIALDNGISEDEIAAFMTEIHTTAFDKAVADGVITREQADWMLQRMQSRWENGYGSGNCPMHSGAAGNRAGFGPGMMGRWR
jgi:Spy/CpxP family protein refolding chaperone